MLLLFIAVHCCLLDGGVCKIKLKTVKSVALLKMISVTDKKGEGGGFIYFFLICEKETKNTPVLSWYCKFPPELCDFKGFKHQLSW